tara:strand:- start:426 stop:575 length:150 start_codon:yes stop_codon:yes gene_type:complete
MVKNSLEVEGSPVASVSELGQTKKIAAGAEQKIRRKLRGAIMDLAKHAS